MLGRKSKKRSRSGLCLFFILHSLFYFILKIFSFDLGKPDSISTNISRKLLSNFVSPPPRYSNECIENDFPPAQTYSPPYYLDILKREQVKGHIIKPVKHEKPIPKNLTCPSCLAPYSFIYSNAPIYSKKTRK